MKASDLMKEFRLVQSGDWWGDTMAWWFAVAGEMYSRGLPIPSAWKYEPGLAPKQPDLYETEICEQASDQALVLFGRALHRYAGILRVAR